MRLRLFAALAIGGVLLTGCAGPTQTKAQACTSLLASTATVTKDLNSSLNSLTTNPTTAMKTLTKASSTFHTGVEKVGNSQVRAVADKADAAVKALAAEINTALANPDSADSAKLTAASTAVSTAFGNVQKLCK